MRRLSLVHGSKDGSHRSGVRASEYALRVVERTDDARPSARPGQPDYGFGDLVKDQVGDGCDLLGEPETGREVRRLLRRDFLESVNGAHPRIYGLFAVSDKNHLCCLLTDDLQHDRREVLTLVDHKELTGDDRVLRQGPQLQVDLVAELHRPIEG